VALEPPDKLGLAEKGVWFGWYSHAIVIHWYNNPHNIIVIIRKVTPIP
jgi:hypothetical protein